MTADGTIKSLVFEDGHKVEWRDEDEWVLKQALAAPSSYYGNGGTIHSTTELDVETDSAGRVVAVWYRCRMLPFRQETVDEERATAMRGVRDLPAITGIEVRDAK